MGAMAVPVGERMGGRWPAPGTIRGAWTAEDLDSLPDDGLRYEIVDGTLIVSPAPAWRHQRASSRLFRVLASSCPAGYEVFYAPLDWRVDEQTVVEPDLLVVPEPSGVDVAVERPLLLVEILSPSSKQFDRVIKFERYARAGVPQYWIVDPGAAGRDPSVEVYDLVDDEYRLQARGVGSEVLAIAGPVAVTVIPANLVTAG